MNARAEMPKAPDWELILHVLQEHISVHYPGTVARATELENIERLRSWLAAQPLAPEGGDDGRVPIAWASDTPYGRGYSFNEEGLAKLTFADQPTPPAPARDAVAWQYRVSTGGNAPIVDWRPWENDERPAKIGRWDAEYRALYTHPAAGAVVVDEAMVAITTQSGYRLTTVREVEIWAAGVKFGREDAALTAAIGGGK